MTVLRRCALLVVCSLGLALVAAPAGATTFRLGERTLRLGTTGGDVKALQQLLTTAGYPTAADGSYGPGTRSSVRAFQRRTRRQATGVVGPGTVKVLKAAAKTAATAGPAPAADPATAADARDGSGGATFGATPASPPASGTGTGAGTGQAGSGTPPTTGTSDTSASGGAATSGLGPAAPPADSGVPGKATLTADGRAVPPPDAPPVIVDLITAANKIARTPYRYGGGHGSFEDTAYDCSGSVSYALHGADLLDTTLDSSALAKYGSSGVGRWVTIYANAEHVYMYVAGLRFDTSGQKASGSRWQSAVRSNAGFTVRHPTGL